MTIPKHEHSLITHNSPVNSEPKDNASHLVRHLLLISLSYGKAFDVTTTECNFIYECPFGELFVGARCAEIDSFKINL